MDTKSDGTAALSQGESAYARLLEGIHAGEFAPGDRLREIDVADRLKLSRTPVREALRRLEADGIVEHRPRIGAVIRSLSHAEIVELYEMRLVLERAAAEMAAKHALPAEIDTLRRINAQIDEAIGDPHRAAASNQTFHRALYHGARNRFLIEAARSLNNALMLLGPTTLADADRIRSVVAEHDTLITAIETGAPEQAGAAAEAHLQTSLRHRLAQMTS